MDDGIIDLFSMLDNKINQYSQKWDRSTLIMVIIINIIGQNIVVPTYLINKTRSYTFDIILNNLGIRN